MNFFKKFSNKDGSINEKKKLKTKKEITSLIMKHQHSEVRVFIPSLNKEDESVLAGIDEAVNELLQNHDYHKQLSDFFIYILESRSPALFKLYFESLLFNESLYNVLVKEQEFATANHFDHFLLFKADEFEDNDAKSYALGVLSMLKDSFYVKDEIEKKFE